MKTVELQEYMGTKLPVGGIWLTLVDRLANPKFNIYYKSPEGDLCIKKFPRGFNFLDLESRTLFNTESWVIVSEKIFQTKKEETKQLIKEIVLPSKIIYFSDVVRPVVRFFLNKETRMAEKLENAKISVEIDPSGTKIRLYKRSL